MTILARSNKFLPALRYEMALPVVRLKDAFGIVSTIVTYACENLHFTECS
jgi:hypothetical protein